MVYTGGCRGVGVCVGFTALLGENHAGSPAPPSWCNREGSEIKTSPGLLQYSFNCCAFKYRNML